MKQMKMPPIAGGFFVCCALLGIAPPQLGQLCCFAPQIVTLPASWVATPFPVGTHYRKKRRYLFLILLLFAKFCCDRAGTPKSPDGTQLVRGRDFRFSNQNGGTTNMAFMVFARRLAPVLGAGLLLSFAATAGFAADERCSQLVALNKQYRHVALTDEQQNLKVQLVSWYKENCGRGHRIANR
jgi:hypothetical protein